ncbi:acyl-CoA thioesterase [Flavobacterium sp.]|uniref:acyl-CoA thioesterase n=1 Tax=Flavobacterium sp. TaxID=239 RepID=UPI003D0A48D3
MKKVLESKVKIRFPDCDPFNHLNNSRYLDYMINAREDQLAMHYDFDVYQMAKETGLSWVVAQNQIAYLFPAFLMEEVIIETQLFQVSEKALMIEAKMWDNKKEILKTVLWTKLVHYDLKTNRSAVHSEELMTFFGQIVKPLEKELSFEERLEEIRKK